MHSGVCVKQKGVIIKKKRRKPEKKINKRVNNWVEWSERKKEIDSGKGLAVIYLPERYISSMHP